MARILKKEDFHWKKSVRKCFKFSMIHRTSSLYIFGAFLAALVTSYETYTKSSTQKLQSCKKRHIEQIDLCNSLKKGREESDERDEALDELKATEQKYNELKDEMAQYADNDPAIFEAMSLDNSAVAAFLTLMSVS